MQNSNEKRRRFLKSAAALGALGAVPMLAEPVQPSARTVVTGGIRVGNLYFSSGITGVRPEAHKNPLLFGGDIKEQTRTILEKHKANLQAMGSSLQHVVKVTVYLADVKTEKTAMNEVYEQYFPMEPPARSAIGVEFPDSLTRLEMDLIALIP